MKVKNPVQPGDGDPRHGNYTTYSNHRCSCELCRSAWAKYNRELQDRKRQEKEKTP